MSLVREKLRLDVTFPSESLAVRQSEENENEPDEKDDDCDGDEDERKCRSSTSKTSLTTSATATSIQSLTISTNPSSSSFKPPGPSLAPPPPPLTLETSTFIVTSSLIPQNPPVVSVPVSTVPPIVSLTRPSETSLISLSTDQKPKPAAPTSSAAAAAAATSRTPPPAQVNSSTDNAGKTAGIILLIIAFFSFFVAIFFYRRWRSRRRRRTNEKGKSSTTSTSIEPPAPILSPSRPALPPLTSNPPMVSLPPPPPAQRTGQAPAQPSLSSNSSLYSDLAVLNAQSDRPAINSRSTHQAAQLASNTRPGGPPRDEKRHVAYGIPTFFQSAINRRARNAENVQPRGESWPPPPYTGNKEPKTSSWRGPIPRSSRLPDPTLTSPRSLPGRRISPSETQESLVLPWRNSVESDISSLSSGWGDGPSISAPVAIARKPLTGHTSFISQARGGEVTQTTPREMV